MKWILRSLMAVGIALVLLVGALVLTAQRTSRPVGFQTVRVTDAGGQAFAVGLWYPTQARPWPTTFLGGVLLDVAANAPVSGGALPLVVISHGDGGGIGSHADLAMALASAGYVVAAPMHPGDNFADQSAAGSASLFSGRAQQLRATIDYLLKDWPGRDRIDARRIGAYGFSAGGFTVLTLIGAKPDWRLLATHCARSPEFVCDVLRRVKSPLLTAAAADTGGAFASDKRIKAAVLAAPGLVFTVGPHGFDDVHAPVQLWSGDRDDLVPYASNAKLVVDALGSGVDLHTVPGAGHVAFLSLCGLLRPPGICSDPAPFDRKAFHVKMDASVTAFFDKHLQP